VHEIVGIADPSPFFPPAMPEFFYEGSFPPAFNVRFSLRNVLRF